MPCPVSSVTTGAWPAQACRPGRTVTRSCARNAVRSHVAVGLRPQGAAHGHPGFAHWQEGSPAHQTPRPYMATRLFTRRPERPGSSGWRSATPCRKMNCSSVTATTCLTAGPAVKEQLGSEFWPLVASLARRPPLDLRVNVLKENGLKCRRACASNYQNRSNALFALGLARQQKADAGKSCRPLCAIGAGRGLAAGPAA